ncbi:GPW/gp25 family protein [Pigmentibacter sp. JX0631]|uniref:GPW/gp25 family protein n=1 Tax=Pigmentibacter sp. JX0631 TaxID=2976982 RepID=UPI002468CC67|nr:GPW/gp25 family protein [Pigmentibacter sp. JX0631]WGL60323.1 GPW/gp25 family protein [Pigmentibacter sp. JX0631]
MPEIIETLFFEKFYTSSIEEKGDDTWKITKRKNILLNSIVSNIYHILNTKSGLTVEQYLEKKLTVLDFGLPDLSEYISAYFVDTKTISNCIIHALHYFEKRIENVQIKVKDEYCKKVIYIVGTVKELEGVNEILAFKAIAGKA